MFAYVDSTLRGTGEALELDATEKFYVVVWSGLLAMFIMTCVSLCIMTHQRLVEQEHEEARIVLHTPFYGMDGEMRRPIRRHPWHEIDDDDDMV
ncbi:hypothetical protein NKR23_g8777 [Pleurostoma richardsiae]|uniref:Uncharacterized protein n=1 Tax=Pleurostoma richardsiae TaxID=41990 RepID=A0AA38RHP8_9PEZI|nr:hypothetical protein NKR23_g8777 [Pleurostoma richardsiae]